MHKRHRSHHQTTSLEDAADTRQPAEAENLAAVVPDDNSEEWSEDFWELSAEGARFRHRDALEAFRPEERGADTGSSAAASSAANP